jgi:hypothetical protein
MNALLVLINDYLNFQFSCLLQSVSVLSQFENGVKFLAAHLNYVIRVFLNAGPLTSMIIEADHQWVHDQRLQFGYAF